MKVQQALVRKERALWEPDDEAPWREGHAHRDVQDEEAGGGGSVCPLQDPGGLMDAKYAALADQADAWHEELVQARARIA
jgi:hypothetical protein